MPTKIAILALGGAVLISLVTATGCAVPGPVSVPPPVEPPAAFSASGERPLPERWWEDFGDPDLDGLVAGALAGNFDLLAAWDRLAQASALARREGAARDVSLDATADPRLGLAHRTLDTSHDNLYGLGLAARFELDLWGRLQARERAAALDAAATAEDLRAAATTLAATVAETWFTRAELLAQLDLLDGQVRTNEQVLELLDVRFKQGRTPAADVLRQRQLIEATRGDRIEVRSRAEVLDHLLAVLAGRPPGGLALPRGRGLPALRPLPATGLPAELVERRPDVRAARLRVLGADRRVAVALADRYPRFTLRGALSTTTPQAGDLFETWFASLALAAVAPLLDGGQRTAEVERTRAVVSERLRAYGAVVLEALREVEDALSREHRQAESLASLSTQLELSRSVLGRLRDRYTRGAADYLDVLAAQTSVQNLERRLLTAKRELVGYRIDLCRALAGGLDLERPAAAELSLPGREQDVDGGTE